MRRRYRYLFAQHRGVRRPGARVASVRRPGVGIVLLASMLASLAALPLTFADEAGARTPVGDSPTFRADTEREFAPDKLIVKIEEDATQADLEEINRRNGARTEEDLPRSDVNVVDLPRTLPVEEAIRRYERSSNVEYAEPDYLLQPSQTAPDDPSYPRLYGLNNAGQTGGTADADIDAPEAWNTTTGDAGTVVAVIDEGVDISHPDLKNNLWTNPDEIPGNGIDDDGNRYVDDVHGFDFANNDASVYDPDPVTGKGDEHGTHVAGTIAAEANNGIGVAGVAYKSRIMSLKFLGPNGGYTSDAVEAINYAVAEGVKISNNSWGGGSYSQSLLDAINRADAAGHLFVAAAGNGGSDGVGDDNDATPQYPASYNSANIISVAATNGNDTMASFSNFGANSVDVAAPGVGILSTLPRNTYGSYSGTSMATPHVSGVAALVKSKNPTADDAGLKTLILNRTDAKTSLQGKVASGGRVNAEQALVAPTESPAPAPEPAPAPAVAPSPAPAPAPPSNQAAPSISGLRPAPGASTRDRTPTISSIVRDSQTELAKGNMALYVDGRRVTTFGYNGGTDRLTYTTGTLAYGRHTVKVVANDGQLSASRTWRFTVAR